jgi:hypothetical protein
MKIDITKKYRTICAKWPVTIVSTDGPYPGFPVVGYIDATSNPLLWHWSEVGGYPANTSLDLIEVREPREWDMWVSPKGDVLHNSDMLMHESIRVREIID